jgi:hypothetical protein
MTTTPPIPPLPELPADLMAEIIKALENLPEPITIKLL